MKNYLQVLACVMVVSVTGCSSLIKKAENASTERAAKFSDAELCEKYLSDTNDYYVAANKAEVEKRGLNCTK